MPQPPYNSINTRVRNDLTPENPCTKRRAPVIYERLLELTFLMIDERNLPVNILAYMLCLN